jgi:hypothetical protein
MSRRKPTRMAFASSHGGMNRRLRMAMPRSAFPAPSLRFIARARKSIYGLLSKPMPYRGFAALCEPRPTEPATAVITEVACWQSRAGTMGASDFSPAVDQACGSLAFLNPSTHGGPGRGA